MTAYAIIETGGKQYRVEQGNVLAVEKLDAEEGKEVTLDRVLAISDGESTQIGSPIVDGASVTAKVVEHFRGKKVVSFKKKRRKGYKRKMGHRQDQTRIEIVRI